MSKFKELLSKINSKRNLNLSPQQKLKDSLYLKQHINNNIKKYVKFGVFTFIIAFSYIAISSDSVQKIITIGVSKATGYVFGIYIPHFMRSAVYNTYIKSFGANYEEILDKNLKNYKNIKQFFIRKIDMSKRPIDKSATIVSPCDGTILSVNEVTNLGEMHVVKGKPYNLLDFLFGNIKSVNLLQPFAKLMNNNNEYRFYQITIYLSPGDYHRYHSPSDLIIHDRVYIPGSLYPVKPSFIEKRKTTFLENERVTLKTSLLSDKSNRLLYITYVGALNVGSIKLHYDDFNSEYHSQLSDHVIYNSYSDKDEQSILQAKKDSSREFGRLNIFRDGNLPKITSDDDYTENKEEQSIKYLKDNKTINEKSKEKANLYYQEKGEEMGYFQFGSTIVMVFPLEENESLSDKIIEGKKIKLGEKIL